MRSSFSLLVAICFLIMSQNAISQDAMKLARLKYNGGGDWYANPTSLPNLIKFCNTELGTAFAPYDETVEASSQDLFNYPFVHMTGHGNVVFNEEEVKNLRLYLESGGFLHIDDNYGMDPYIRLELKKIFPNRELVEIPYDHEIFHQRFDFDRGLPKVHEHDGKAAKGYAILIEDRIAVFYTLECDLGDGWEDEEVHNDPEHIRKKALQMGANIIQYVFTLN